MTPRQWVNGFRRFRHGSGLLKAGMYKYLNAIFVDISTFEHETTIFVSKRRKQPVTTRHIPEEWNFDSCGLILV
jgi:hypothetical protein